jgi:hypothetical protein
MGRVTVSGGQLTIPEIITQLQWIVPEDNYQWDVVMVEENVYRVNFPSKMDLVRVQHFGRFNVPNSQVFMTFDFWTRNVEPSWRAEDVWVRVHDLPSPVLDDFLALWALGTLFGKTKDIDMAFTRANDDREIKRVDAVSLCYQELALRVCCGVIAAFRYWITPKGLAP